MNDALVRKYISLEAEVDMRLRYKKILEIYGQAGLATTIGEMAACLQVALDVMGGK